MQVPPTTDGKRTTTAWSQTGFQEGLSQKLSKPLLEMMPQPAWMTPHLTLVMLWLTRTMNRTYDTHDYIDVMEMVEATSMEDEIESAWREDSDENADEHP